MGAGHSTDPTIKKYSSSRKVVFFCIVILIGMVGPRPFGSPPSICRSKALTAKTDDCPKVYQQQQQKKNNIAPCVCVCVCHYVCRNAKYLICTCSSQSRLQRDGWWMDLEIRIILPLSFLSLHLCLIYIDAHGPNTESRSLEKGKKASPSRRVGGGGISRRWFLPLVVWKEL